MLGTEDEAPRVKHGLAREDKALVLEEEAPNEDSLVPLRCTPSFGGYMKTWSLSPITLGKIVIRVIVLGVVASGVSRFVAGDVSGFVGDGVSWFVGGASRFVGGAALSILTI